MVDNISTKFDQWEATKQAIEEGEKMCESMEIVEDQPRKSGHM